MAAEDTQHPAGAIPADHPGRTHYVVLSKKGCPWCEKAVALLDETGDSHSCSYDVVHLEGGEALQAALAVRGCVAVEATSFPQIMESTGWGWRYVGGHDRLRDRLRNLSEPLLVGREVTSRRFTPFPVVEHDVWEFYLKAVASFWTADEVNMAGDLEDWRTLTDDERRFIKHVLAFFAGSDGIIMENLQANFGVEIRMPEARQFYAYQAFNEAEHSRMYGLMIDALIADSAERERLFWAIESMPAVAKKAEWAAKWLDPARSLATRLFGMMCVEGILFSGSFCAIFWLKQRGLMPGLCLSNNFISRDEGLHQLFGALMYSKVVHRLTEDEARAIMQEAVNNEKEFICEAVPCRLVGMNSDLMAQYIEFVADKLLESVGYAPMYGSPNPFAWMELISLSAKDNFFERFSSEYQKAGVMTTAADRGFATDAAF
jgi:ribonucleotide reductase beta subunit family protein with ferritin-like domain/glutaredoxin